MIMLSTPSVSDRNKTTAIPDPFHWENGRPPDPVTLEGVDDETRVSRGRAPDFIVAAVATSRKETNFERSAHQADLRWVAKDLMSKVSNRQQFLLSMAEEKGVSSWLTAEPSFENGTILKKSDFEMPFACATAS